MTSEFCSHNKFNILNSLDSDNSSLDSDIKSFNNLITEVGKDLDLYGSSRKSFKSYYIDPNIKKLIEKKRKLEKRLKSRVKHRHYYHITEIINKARDSIDLVNKNMRLYRKLSFLKWIKVGCKHANDGNLRFLWKWHKRTSHYSDSHSNSSPAIQDKNGKYLFSPMDKVTRWGEYYKELASDPFQHSMDTLYWENKFGINNNNDIIWPINDVPLFDEIRTTILDMNNNKAPGNDGIPVEVYKAFFADATNKSAPALYFTKLCKRLWLEGIPNSWNTASIVSIPKKGDLSDCSNYRGISLINVGIKVISKLLANRISKYALDNGFIRLEQFGFRTKEECISLFISIRDLCQRRAFSNQDTYLAFLDLKKAYDSVPIQGLLCKLWNLGIRNEAFMFIKNLYLSSSAQARCENLLSEPFKVLRGVRQGCPLSPILFNLFINDALKYTKGINISSDSSSADVEFKCSGGLFADDIVLCGKSMDDLQYNLNCVSEWADNNDMCFGISKCATMIIYHNQLDYNTDYDISHNPIFTLQNQVLPRVKEYKYLGLCFHHTLSIQPIINITADKIRKALFSIKPFLQCRMVPLIFRLAVFRACIIGLARYPAPLLGSNKNNTSKIQNLISLGMYWIAGFKCRSNSISFYCLSKEFGIPPYSAICALAEYKAYKKWTNSNCIISKLIQTKPRTLKHYWSKEARLLVDRIEKKNLTTDAQILEYYWHRDLVDSRSSHIYSDRYDILNFINTRNYLIFTYIFPQFFNGWLWLLRFRCGYNWNPNLAKVINYATNDCPDKCILCYDEPFSYYHMLFDCRCNMIWPLYQRELYDYFIEATTGDNLIRNSSVIRQLNEFDHHREKYFFFFILLGGSLGERTELFNRWFNSTSLHSSSVAVLVAYIFDLVVPTAICKLWALLNRYKST